jgi:hypothetical protein
MYIEFNLEARLHNQYCCEKAVNIKYYECASVFLR